jgi:phospholipase C
MTNTRRSLLKSFASAAALSALPPNLRAALADPLPGKTGTIQDVEHIVIFMQENRSFDHYFGTLRGVRGFNDPRAITLPSGKPVWYQPKADEDFTPFHLDTRKTSAQCMADLDHSWKGSYDLWKNHDAWVETKTKMTMGYFERHDIPFYHTLADAFTICDAYHASVFGPTSPNRLHLWSGTSGLTVNHDQWAVSNPDEENETADIKNDTKKFDAFTWTTYAEQLQKAGIDWRIYQEYDNYGDNGLAYFANFREGGDPALIERARSWVKGSNAHNARTSRGEHLVAAFAQDVAMNRLPQVSWIVAPYIMCEHPSATPAYGEALTAQLLDVLASNKDVWSKTVFILNYDENDGFFDHVPPPIPAITPDMGASTVNVTGEIYQGVPFGLGPRVPMIVVSPWTTGGFVNSQVFDHTSVLRFLETRFGVTAPNISDWRRAVAGDLMSIFDFSQTGSLEHFADGTKGMKRADKQCKLPAPNWLREDLPQQEKGIRPARPLPYDLDVAGKTVTDGFQLDFQNNGSAGAAFRVAAADAKTGPWFFTVEAGKTLSYTLPRDGAYDFSLLGPNGFFRHFKGSGDDRVEATVRFMRAAGTVELAIRNGSVAAISLHATGAYFTPERTVEILPGETDKTYSRHQRSGNWYDFRIEGTDGLVRHLAGHIETGGASMSDPLLS